MAEESPELKRLTQEILRRAAAGEALDVADYCRRYPHLAEALRGVFAMLAAAGSSEKLSSPQGTDTAATIGYRPGTAGGSVTAGGTKGSLSGGEDGPDPRAVTRSAPLGSGAKSDSLLRAGEQLGDYELLGEIARGGMGVVFRARQISLNRMVALKMIKSGQLADRDEIRRFQAEARHAARLRHPNIVDVYQVGQHDGLHYFAMEFIEGISLAQRITQGPIPFDQAAEYLQIVSEAIQYAHDQGVLHRDLKPSNVLIDADGRLRVTDFGLAKRLDTDEQLTQSGSVLGTPQYMPPEQAAGKNDQMGPPSDVYSLGAILYEMLCGQPPFRGDSALDTLWQVMEEEPTPPRRINPEVPRDLETICLKCLAKAPAERFATPGDLAAELRRYLQGQSIRTKPLGKSAHGARSTWYIISAILLAAVVGIRFPQFSLWLAPGGDAFLSVLKMIVVPLVMASVMAGVLGLGDVRRLGKPGLATLLYFLVTTLCAAMIGLLCVNLLRPGESLSVDLPAAPTVSAPAKPPMSISESLVHLFKMLFTDNLFAAMSKGDLMPLILFSMVFAGLLTTMGRRADTLSRLIHSVNHALLELVLLLMRIAPLGIFCLVAARFGKAAIGGKLVEEFQNTFWYMSTVLLGLALHTAIVLFPLLFLLGRRNPWKFLWQVSEALLTALGTSSSSATLPVTIECTEKQARVNRKAVDFVVPLGSTINMNGTALYEACAAMFIAQAYQHSTSFIDQITISLTATLAAIGAAGIPEAGLVTMVMVLNAVGLPLEGIGLILSVDWLLDRFRTTVNVLGDMVGAAVVERTFVTPQHEQPAIAGQAAASHPA